MLFYNITFNMKNNTKKDKKNIIRFLLVIIIFIVVYFIIRNTYSKYLTMQESNAQSNISKWHILVNNQDITQNKDFSQNLNLILDKNPNIAEDVIVPTTTGHFDVEIDSTGTDLPFKYELQIAEAVDSVSTYSINVEKYEKDEYNQTTQLYFSVFIDYSYRDTPIAYYDTNGQLIYDKIPITLSIPKGKISQVQMDNYESMEFEDGTFTFIPQWYQWSTDNILETTVRLYYDEIIELSDVSTPVENLTLGGNIVKKTNLPDFKIYAYSLNGSEIIYLDSTTTTLTETVTPPDDINQEVKNNLTLYVTWYDEEDNILNNFEDVETSKLQDAIGTINLKLKLTQIE